MYTPIFAKNNPFFFSPMIIAIVKDGFVILQQLIEIIYRSPENK